MNLIRITALLKGLWTVQIFECELELQIFIASSHTIYYFVPYCTLFIILYPMLHHQHMCMEIYGAVIMETQNGPSKNSPVTYS